MHFYFRWLFGNTTNLGRISAERNLSSTIRVISIPQSKYGERIKAGSVRLVDNTNSVTFTDNEDGSFRSGNPSYTINSLNFSTGVIEIEDNDGDIFSGTITAIDFSTGVSTITFSGDTETFTIVKLDLVNGTLETSVSLSSLYEGLDIDEALVGNIFYSDGLIVFNNVTAFHEYELSYKSTKTIYETEIFVNARIGEFNYSQNPSAVEVQISGSYDFETTKIFNDRPAVQKRLQKLKILKEENFIRVHI